MSDPNQFDQLALVGKISLWFSLVALIGLLAVVWIAGGAGGEYLEQIQNLAWARKNLPFIMLSGGLLLVFGTGLTTWVIVLYSTFRVAGPLYRFSQNLDQGVSQGEVPQVPIRQKDQLQAESQLLQGTVSTLYGHYADLDRLVEQVAACHENSGGEGADAVEAVAELEAAIEQLRHIARQARHD